MRTKFRFPIFSFVFVSIVCLTLGLNQSFAQAKDLGIGPIKSVKIDAALDPKMVSQGKGIFNEKCMLCHELDQVKIGPPLRNITKDRAPEYIMNLLLNTSQMQKENANIKALIKKYNNIVMTNPELTQDKARSVVEYLRSVAK